MHRCARLNPKKLAPVPLGKVPVGDHRGQGLPNTVINALAYNPAVDVLAVSAFGRGAWALYTVSVVARFYWTFGGGAGCASQQNWRPMSQMGHSRRYCHVRSLDRYPPQLTLPRPTDSRLLVAFRHPICQTSAAHRNSCVLSPGRSGEHHARVGCLSKGRHDNCPELAQDLSPRLLDLGFAQYQKSEVVKSKRS